MKKTIYTAIATLLFLISSCTLEQEVYNKINPGMFPQNAEDVNALVNSSAYYVFSPWGIFEVAAGYVTTSEMVTDYVENTWGWTTVYNSYEAKPAISLPIKKFYATKIRQESLTANHILKAFLYHKCGR